MKKKFLQSEKLDEIGIKLMKSASLKEEEIEKIVSNPHLFDSITAKIEREKIKRGDKKVSNALIEVSGLSRKKTSLALAFAVILLAFTGLFIFKNFEPKQILISENSESLHFHIQKIPDDSIPPPASQKDEIESRGKIISFTKTKRDLQRTPVKENKKLLKKRVKEKTAKPTLTKVAGDEEVFYPLMFAGDLSNEDNRQIIRVALSRESLAALGVYLPIEDENRNIETDLIVGLDGMPQAYRFVRNY